MTRSRPLRWLSMWPLVYMALVACAGSGLPREYRQGAVVAPRAPVFNPTLDAPVTTGQPGHVAPAKMPRSPYGRVLPETPETRKEPGIWAGNVERLPVTPVIGGVQIPFPDGAEDDAAQNPTRVCALSIGAVLNDVQGGVGASLLALPAGARECMAARLFATCATTYHQRLARHVLARNSAEEIARWAVTATHAERLRARACDGVTFDIPTDTIISSVEAMWTVKTVTP